MQLSQVSRVMLTMLRQIKGFNEVVKPFLCLVSLLRALQ